MFQRISEKDRKNFIIALICVAVAAVVYFVFKYILILVAPFLLGILFTMMIRRPVEFMKRKLHIPVGIGTFLSLCVITAVLTLALWYVGGKFVAELKNFIASYDIYYQMLIDKISVTCCTIDDAFGLRSGCTFEALESNINQTVSRTSENIIPSVMKQLLGLCSDFALCFTAAVIAVTSVFFLIRDMDEISCRIKCAPASKWLRIAFGRLSSFGAAYIKTQLIIMSITAGVCTFALFLIGNSYPLMIGILIGILDALPILGTGTVMIPWIVILLISGKIYRALVLVAAYIICYIVRQFLEPKLMGSRMGVHPLVLLITMYAGFFVFGIFGFVLGPAAYLIVTEVVKYFYNIL